MTLNIQRLHTDAILPTRAHPNDAGLDLASNIDTTVGVSSRVTIGTGIAIALPTGTAGLITRWLYRDHHKYKNRGLNQDD